MIMLDRFTTKNVHIPFKLDNRSATAIISQEII